MIIKNTLKKSYPKAYKEFCKINRLPLSQKIVFLNEKTENKIKKIVKSFHQLREDSIYQQAVLKENYNLIKKYKKHHSPLMAYDFHLQKDIPKLIEINTNASGFLLSNLLYQFSNNKSYKEALEALKKSFLKEWILFGSPKKKPKIVLIDENIEKQKMRFEFFMYQDFFNSIGWDLEILESKSLLIDEQACLYSPSKEKIDFIYNRTTDFYFKEHSKLLEVYKKKSCLILPQPLDYALLSDKKRFLDWQGHPQLKSIQKHLLKTQIFNNEEEIWQVRKKYFFKAQQGYGGRLAYRGSSLSSKKRKELWEAKSLVQEYCPPSQWIDSKGDKWKMDVRAYAYRDQVQQLVARVYQGQITNFQAKGSGFAKVSRLNKR